MAARFGACASAGEILVSWASLTDAEPSLITGDPETVKLKGVAEPVAVVAVHWS